MLTEDAVAAWLTDSGVTAKCYFDGTPWTDIQDRKAIVLGLYGGGPDQFERTFDQPGLQVLARGDQTDHAGARDLAYQIDSVFETAVPPLTLGGAWVISINRVGGPPRLLMRDTSRRFIFTCNYVFLSARQ